MSHYDSYDSFASPKIVTPYHIYKYASFRQDLCVHHVSRCHLGLHCDSIFIVTLSHIQKFMTDYSVWIEINFNIQLPHIVNKKNLLHESITGVKKLHFYLLRVSGNIISFKCTFEFAFYYRLIHSRKNSCISYK